MSKLVIQVLGGFDLAFDSHAIKGMQTERLVLLLSHLSLNYAAPVSRKQLAFLFWPDSAEEQARTNLRNLLHLLKRALPEIDFFLEMDNQSIGWKKGVEIELDVKRFKETLNNAKETHDDTARISLLTAALNHYRGEFLPGYYQDWVLLQREELQQLFIGALTQSAKLLEENRRYPEAIQMVNRLMRADALNESAYEQAMRLHALNHDRASALQVYHACATILKQDLGVEPSKNINALYAQLVQSSDVTTKEVTQESKRLIGRKEEWRKLKDTWQSTIKGKTLFALISGEAGIGKTRLATELLQWARRQGVVTASAQCYPAEGDLPFAPVIAWLRAAEIQAEVKDLEPLWKKEISRLMPEYAESTESARIENQKWQRHRLFEALAKALIGRGSPRLFLLDDAQWSDRETIEFLHYLMRYNTDAPLLIVATLRIEDLEEHSPVKRLRDELQTKHALTEMQLPVLAKDEIGEIARDVIGNELSAANLERLYDETEGNPFFAVEIVRSGELGAGKVLPASLRTVLNQRLNQLSPAAREAANLASVIGRDFNLRLLMQSGRMDEDALVQALDELWSKRILQTQPNNAYMFTHGKLQEAAYESISGARRLLYHKKVAEALLAGADKIEHAIVARHFEKAEQPQVAAEQYLQAADAARQVFANAEAISYLERSLTLAPTKASRQLFELLGDLYEMSGKHKQALEAFNHALSQMHESEPLVRAKLLGKLAKATANSGAYADGSMLFEQALQTLDEAPADSQNHWWQTWLKIQFDRTWVDYDASNIEGMQATLEALRPVVERRGEPDKLGEYYFLAPTVHFRRDGYQMNEEIMRWSTLALEASKKAENPELLTRAHFGYGFCNFLLGKFDLAAQHLTESLKIAEQIGYMEMQIYNLTYLAAAYRCAENLEECRKYAERALLVCEREDEKSFAATAFANLGWLAWKANDLRQAKILCQRAAAGWSKYYPFKWYGLWVLIDLSLLALRVEDAVEYARQLRAPGQQVFAKTGDTLLMEAIQAADEGKLRKSQPLLEKAVAWAKENHYL